MSYTNDNEMSINMIIGCCNIKSRPVESLKAGIFFGKLKKLWCQLWKSNFEIISINEAKLFFFIFTYNFKCFSLQIQLM